MSEPKKRCYIPIVCLMLEYEKPYHAKAARKSLFLLTATFFPVILYVLAYMYDGKTDTKLSDYIELDSTSMLAYASAFLAPVIYLLIQKFDELKDAVLNGNKIYRKELTKDYTSLFAVAFFLYIFIVHNFGSGQDVGSLSFWILLLCIVLWYVHLLAEMHRPSLEQKYHQELNNQQDQMSDEFEALIEEDNKP